MLHQLKNGDWIDLRDVRSVYTSPIGRPAVIVIAGDRYHDVLCPSVTEAQTYRDELAAMVNQAQDTGGQPLPGHHGKPKEVRLKGPFDWMSGPLPATGTGSIEQPYPGVTEFTPPNEPEPDDPEAGLTWRQRKGQF